MGWIFKNTCVQCMDAHTCTCTHTTCNHISLYTLLIINLFVIFIYLFLAPEVPAYQRPEETLR